MSTAIALTSQPLSEQWKYAQALAQAGLLPKQYRDSPGDVLLAIAYADALSLPVAQIFTGIHVIEGRPSMSAELMGALVRRAGHRIRMSGDATSARAEIVRRDDPDYTYRSTFTLDDAKQAGLLNKDVWKKYPAAMLLARAGSGRATIRGLPRRTDTPGTSSVPSGVHGSPASLLASRIALRNAGRTAVTSSSSVV